MEFLWLGGEDGEVGHLSNMGYRRLRFPITRIEINWARVENWHGRDGLSSLCN